MKRDSLTYLIYLVLLPALLLAAACFSRRAHERPAYKKGRLLMGTVVEITVSGAEDPNLARQAVDAAFREIERVENKFSAYKPDSDVGRINRLAPGRMLEVDDETLRLIEAAIDYNAKTAGAFDITVKPLVDLWGFSSHEGRVPSADEIRAALSLVGPDKIIVDRPNKKIGVAKEGVRIDLGGIAKGYATDMAIAALKRSGIKNAIVNSGGDMYCLGRRNARELWRVGIQHPRRKDSLIASLALEDAAVNTSGDYENFFKVGGKRFCHIIDPRTGMPVGSLPSSATIIAKNSTEAQSLAKVQMVLGAAEGAGVIEKNFAVDWIVISEEAEGRLSIQESKGIGKYAYKKK